MSDQVGTEQDWTRAREANALRQQGQTTRAIERYDEVIAAARRRGDARLLSQAYAGRGAVKIALGFYSARDPRDQAPGAPAPDDDSAERGAIEDLALATQLDPQNGWAWAQLGEAHRSFGRDHFRLMPEARFDAHVEEALRAFERARALLPEQEAWLLAHEAAAHFLGLWRAYDLDTATLPDLEAEPEDDDARRAREHLKQAKRGFRQALELNPNYAWAKRFYAYLLTITGKYKKAQRLLADALLDDPRAELHVIRSLSMLYRYAAQAKPKKRERLLALALRASQQAMERDSEDFFAVYAHAAACTSLGVAGADGIARDARTRILNQAVRAVSMAFALHLHGREQPEEFLRLLADALGRAHADPEIVAIAHHDPVWRLPMQGPGAGGGTLLAEIKKHIDGLVDKL